MKRDKIMKSLTESLLTGEITERNYEARLRVKKKQLVERLECIKTYKKK